MPLYIMLQYKRAVLNDAFSTENARTTFLKLFPAQLWSLSSSPGSHNPSSRPVAVCALTDKELETRLQ